MKTKHYILTILAVTIFLLGYCTRYKIEKDNIQDADTVTVVKTEYETVTDTLITYVPKPYKVTEIDTLIILDSANCQKMAKLYFAEVSYKDTLINDSILFLELLETISRNRITNRSINYRANEKIVTVTNTITHHPKWHFTADASLYFDKSMIIGGTVIKGKKWHKSKRNR